MSLWMAEACQNITNAQLQKKYIDATGWTFTASVGRDSLQALTSNTNSDQLDVFTGGATTLWAGFWGHIVGGLPGTFSTVIEFWNHNSSASFPNASVFFRSDGDIEVRRGASTVLATSTSTPIVADTDFICEVKYFSDNSTGNMEVWIDGTKVVEFTGDTQNGGIAGTTSITFAGVNTRTMYWNDLYVLDDQGSELNDRLGLWQIDSVLPNGDGTTNDFPTLVPSSPTTHYTKVDEASVDDDTSYVESVTAGDIELFEFANLPAFAGSSIAAVQLNFLGRKDEAGATREVHAVSRPVATNYFGTNKGLPAEEYQHFLETWVANPETSLPWTDAEFNASEFGVELDV